MFDISRETAQLDADIGRQLRPVQLSVHLVIFILIFKPQQQQQLTGSL